MWLRLVSGLLTPLIPVGTPSLWFSLSGYFSRHVIEGSLAFNSVLLTPYRRSAPLLLTVAPLYVFAESACTVFSDGTTIIVATTQASFLALLGTRCTTNFRFAAARTL